MEKTLHGTGRVVFAALLLGLNLSLAFAQMSAGTILGTVKDSTGAVVPDSTVTVRNVETGFTRTLNSESNGTYRVSALPVGTYEIRAEQTGFRTEVHSAVRLAVGQEAVVNFSLQVGAVEQTVEVTGEAPLVNTTSGSLGNLVNEQQVSDLPLNGRNYINLTLLQPGVVQHQKAQSNLMGAGTWMSIGGAPNRSNYYLMDGAPMNNYNDGSIASIGGATLGVEAIREWRLVTSAHSAEYGMRMGGQMVIVTKSGTNTFHGSLFEYLRNSALDARNFFDYKTEAFGGRLPGFRRNQYGGSLGGPIKKDKLFFFTNYEGLKERLGVTTVSNTIGSGCQGSAGVTITNIACPQLGTTASVAIAPVVAPLLALYPAPNLPGNRYTFPFNQPTDEHYGLVRADYNFSATDSAFVRFTIDDGHIDTPLTFPQFKRVGESRKHFLTVSESHTFGPALVGTFRFSYSAPRITVDTVSDIVSPQYSLLSGLILGPVSIGGVTTLGSDGNTPSSNTPHVYTYSGDIFYSKGRHSLKFGTLVNRNKVDISNGSQYRGSISFPNVAGFLAGRANSYRARTPGSELTGYTFMVQKYTTIGFYLQDDLRLRPNLTLNLGLRYEFHDEFDSNFNSSLRDIRRDTSVTIGPAFLNPSLKNLSPRFGFAWDIRGDGKTAVRGGFGLLHDIAAWNQALNRTIPALHPWSTASTVDSVEFPQYSTITTLPLVFPPEALGKSVVTMDYHIQNPHIVTHNLTVERELPYQIALSLGYVGSRGINLMSAATGNPRLHSVLPDGRFFWAGNEPRANSNWTDIIQMSSPLSSWYSSLQFVVTKRLSHGLQFSSSYTWGKLIDEKTNVTGPDGGGSSKIATQLLPHRLDKAPSDVTIAHSWRFSAIYRLPQASGLTGIGGHLLNGWWVSGIVTAQTGLPFTVTTGGRDRSRSLGAGNLPDLNPRRWNPNIISGTTAGCAGVAPGQKLGGPERYYDPCAFSLEPEGFLGNQGRNILTAPGLANLDFSLVKDTKLGFLGEGGNIQFRAEVFNLLNRANFSRPESSNFSAPNTSVLATAGTVSSTDTTSRQIQLALKVIW